MVSFNYKDVNVKWEKFIRVIYSFLKGFLGGAVVKNQPASAGNARDVSLILGSGGSPGVGNGNPLQYSCLENSMDRGAWWITIHGVTKSRTRLTHIHTSTYQSVSFWVLELYLHFELLLHVNVYNLYTATAANITKKKIKENPKIYMELLRYNL